MRPVNPDHAVSNLGDASAKLGTAAIMNLKALVVDDSMAVRQQVCAALQMAGVQATEAPNAAVALSKLSQERFDFVILDVVMPGMDGMEACKAVRAGQNGQDTTILMLTSEVRPSSRVQAALSGCDAFLTKPIEKKSFYEAVDKAIAKRAELRGVPIEKLQGGRGLMGLLSKLRS